MIDNTEGMLRVSSFGNVESRYCNRWPSPKWKRIGFTEKIGYRGIRIKNRMVRVHRLVAEAFIPNPENKPQVNHKNGIKTDNRIENLEWCTDKENHSHAVRNGLITPQAYKNFRLGSLKTQKGETHSQAKISENDVREIRNILKEGHDRKKVSMLALKHNVTPSTIRQIRRGHSWKHIPL